MPEPRRIFARKKEEKKPLSFFRGEKKRPDPVRPQKAAEVLLSALENFQRPGRLLWLNFLVGTMRGLGFLVGTMVVIAALVWIFRILGGMPLIGEWILRGIDFVRENADLSLIPSASSVNELHLESAATADFLKNLPSSSPAAP